MSGRSAKVIAHEARLDDDGSGERFAHAFELVRFPFPDHRPAFPRRLGGPRNEPEHEGARAHQHDAGHALDASLGARAPDRVDHSRTRRRLPSPEAVTRRRRERQRGQQERPQGDPRRPAHGPGRRHRRGLGHGGSGHLGPSRGLQARTAPDVGRRVLVRRRCSALLPLRGRRRPTRADGRSGRSGRRHWRRGARQPVLRRPPCARETWAGRT
mmetsp:Transcript_65786/g.177713  ORF Transcript_65786/g.177713 Transcript_65786/m.177713 type:complete len:213 (-) Transcript_65786:9-647(-)